MQLGQKEEEGLQRIYWSFKVADFWLGLCNRIEGTGGRKATETKKQGKK